jgi:enoyl-CoA hydratase
MQTQDILFEKVGGMGVITLNRPQALNALNLDMIRAMDPQLVVWAKDPAIKGVIIEGAGDRAFCSGGDVKTVAIEVKEKGRDSALGRDFFREEYILNNRIFTFPKPYISLINGIVMGGGKGLSAHGSHRIVTEKTLFAMPETNIGFFPDVGGGYFLPRCPGETGVYLAMTSKRINAADTLYIGFATHYVASDKIAALRQALCDDAGNIDAVLARFVSQPQEASEVEKYRGQIDACFNFDSVEQIIKALKDDGSAFATETLVAMNGMSPTSLKVALQQIRRGAEMKFQDVMTMEYRLSQALVARPDFYEGIRAALIDKDRQPKWNPARPEDVSDQDIESCFKPLGAGDLVL